MLSENAIKHARAWVKDLRREDLQDKQCQGRLKRIENGIEKFCCAGRYCVINNFEIEMNHILKISYYCGITLELYKYPDSDAKKVWEEMKNDFDFTPYVWNDEDNLTFAQIADKIEKIFPEVKEN